MLVTRMLEPFRSLKPGEDVAEQNLRLQFIDEDGRRMVEEIPLARLRPSLPDDSPSVAVGKRVCGKRSDLSLTSAALFGRARNAKGSVVVS